MRDAVCSSLSMSFLMLAWPDILAIHSTTTEKHSRNNLLHRALFFKSYTVFLFKSSPDSIISEEWYSKSKLYYKNKTEFIYKIR